MEKCSSLKYFKTLSNHSKPKYNNFARALYTQMYTFGVLVKLKILTTRVFRSVDKCLQYFVCTIHMFFRFIFIFFNAIVILLHCKKRTLDVLPSKTSSHNLRLASRVIFSNNFEIFQNNFYFVFYDYCTERNSE